MEKIEYLDPAIAGEGFHAEKWEPGAWTDAPDDSAEEWQPEMEPPHINDYAGFKKHKHYRQYFRPWRYVPFPAFMYHATLGERLVKSKAEVEALGPEWSPKPPEARQKKVDMTGKSLPVKTDTQRLAEVVAQALGGKPATASAADPTLIAAVVAAVMAAMKAEQKAPIDPESDSMMPATAESAGDSIERTALIELADKEKIKIDKRWSTAKIKETLGLL
jgi:hypothetical protein